MYIWHYSSHNGMRLSNMHHAQNSNVFAWSAINVNHIKHIALHSIKRKILKLTPKLGGSSYEHKVVALNWKQWNKMWTEIIVRQNRLCAAVLKVFFSLWFVWSLLYLLCEPSEYVQTNTNIYWTQWAEAENGNEIMNLINRSKSKNIKIVLCPKCGLTAYATLITL